MAGLLNGVFKTKISKYLLALLEKVKIEQGEESKPYKALYNQYMASPLESQQQKEINLKHYDATLHPGNGLPNGIERLYKRQLVIDITMVCAAHCRYCLRANYEVIQLKKNEIDDIVNYCSTDPNLYEVLVTGGDPFMVQNLLKYLIVELVDKAPNIKVIRMGTRVPVQDPEKLNTDIYSFFKNYSNVVRFEVGIQVNHSIELQKETINIIKKFQQSGVIVYSQNVLLKQVNDDLDTLIELYDSLRYLGVEAHYLFHSIPMKGTYHLRTSIKKGLNLIQRLNSSGKISGRIKPSFSLMTYVGKVTLYEGSLIKKDAEGYYHVQTYYTLQERKQWNPDYELPQEQSYIGVDGFIVAKYLDGED